MQSACPLLPQALRKMHMVESHILMVYIFHQKVVDLVYLSHGVCD